MEYESPIVESLGQEDISTLNQTDAGWFWTDIWLAAYAVVAAGLVLVTVDI